MGIMGCTNTFVQAVYVDQPDVDQTTDVGPTATVGPPTNKCRATNICRPSSTAANPPNCFSE